MATNLFAMPGTVGGHASGGTVRVFNNHHSNSQKPLVEFKAGKMNYTESTKRVVPDKRKGLIQLIQVSIPSTHPHTDS